MEKPQLFIPTLTEANKENVEASTCKKQSISSDTEQDSITEKHDKRNKNKSRQDHFARSVFTAVLVKV